MLLKTPSFLKKPNPFAPRQYGHVERVTPRVFIFRNITNSSFVIGDRSVAVIDTQVNRPSAERLLAAIRTVTSKPISHVINTHYHWDHTNGNHVFKNAGAEIVSSRLTKDFMVSRNERQKEFLAGRGFELGSDPLLPETVFEGEQELELGGMRLRLFFAGRAETDDATAVHVPSESVLMSGDTVMTGSFPIFGQPVWDEGLQNEDWISAIRMLQSLEPKRILPGHGPVTDDTGLELLIRIQRYFLEEVSALVQKGFSAEAVLANLEPRLPGWITEIPLVWGTPRYAILRVYRGLTRREGDPEQGWQRFKPSAVPAADAHKLESAVKGKEELSDYLETAHEAEEGGDIALKLGILAKAAQRFPSADAWAAYAEALVEASRSQASVLEKGDFFSAARGLWDRALASDPRHAPSLLGKGRHWVMMAYRGGDDPQRGMELLESVLALNPPAKIAAQAEFYLGMGRRRLGDEGRAREHFKKALLHDPAFMPARLAQG